MKKLVCMMMIASYNVHGMDQPEAQKAIVVQKCVSKKCIPHDWRRVKSNVAQRHNVPVFHEKFHNAAIYNHTEEVQKMLQSAGADAMELVSTMYTGYGAGTVLDLTFIENKPEIRNILWPYLDNNVRKQCFESNKWYCLNQLWATESYKMGLMSNLPVVRIIRYLHRKDPVEFSLEPHELEQLNNDIEKWQSKK
jgi:hypothetical protein